MSFAGRLLEAARPLLGEALIARLRANLPSRKPQLWERLPRVALRRAEEALRSRLDPAWLDRPRVVRVPDPGFLMEVVPRNYFIDRFVLVFGVYEISGTRFLKALLHPGMTVLDVGANAGYYALCAARLVGPGGLVYAFEPVPDLRAKLARNVALNGFDQVRVEASAVGDLSGVVRLYVSEIETNDGLASLVPGPGRSPDGIDVAAVTLDGFAAGLERPVDLVKIDVEGAEERVLAGARGLLRGRSPPALLVESERVEALLPVLEDAGYEVRHLGYSLERGLELVRMGEPFDRVFHYEGMNYVALPRRGRFCTFEEIAARSHSELRPWLRWLGRAA
jgi:FkbM family methyltransferase